jgi:hypothetical protein
MALIILFHTQRFRYFLQIFGVILANSAAFAFLDYQRSISDRFWMYLVIIGLELVMLLIVGLIFNKAIGKDPEDDEVDLDAIAIPIPQTLQHTILDTTADMEEKQAVHLGSTPPPNINIDEERAPILERTPIVEQPKQAAEPEILPSIPLPEIIDQQVSTTNIEESQKSLPIRIDIDMEDLKRCFEQYNRLSGKDEDLRFEGKENEIRTKLEALELKEQELIQRIAVVKSKEKIIEKTIDNLEQISKTIKDRTTMLEEKEEYIKKQMDWIEQREDGYSAIVQSKLYDLVFDDLDILGNEVKLKDEKREIIIDKNDLTEIRRTIEETMEEARKGMKQ